MRMFDDLLEVTTLCEGCSLLFLQVSNGPDPGVRRGFSSSVFFPKSVVMIAPSVLLVVDQGAGQSLIRYSTKSVR